MSSGGSSTPVTDAPRFTRAQQRVARSILMDGPATPGELAARLRISAAAVRRHLDALTDSGHLVFGSRPAYGPAPERGRGRPPKVYSLSESGREAFSQPSDDLALSALRFIAEVSGEEAVSTFARKRGQEMEARYRPRVEAAGNEPLDRLEALTAALTEDGFAATIVDDGFAGGVQLCQHTCPVSHVARDFPSMCEQEAAAMGRLLGTNVVRLATIAGGAGVCTCIVSGVPSQASRTTDTKVNTDRPDEGRSEERGRGR